MLTKWKNKKTIHFIFSWQHFLFNINTTTSQYISIFQIKSSAHAILRNFSFTLVYFGSEWCLSINDRLMNTEQSDSSAVLFNSLFFILKDTIKAEAVWFSSSLQLSLAWMCVCAQEWLKHNLVRKHQNTSEAHLLDYF